MRDTAACCTCYAAGREGLMHTRACALALTACKQTELPGLEDEALAPDPADPDSWPDSWRTAVWYDQALDPHLRGPDMPDHECEVYLGTHRPHWLHPGRRQRRPAGPLFVSIRQLVERRRSPYPACDTAFAIDSGGFTELRQHGGWQRTPSAYADQVRRIAAETGTLEWAASQDWMCEDDCLAATGATIEAHQRRSVLSFVQLRELAPDVRWLAVLQGQTPAQYEAHVRMYEANGVALQKLALVGVGSVCRRQGSSEIAALLRQLVAHGMRLHGFGVKQQGLAAVAPYLASVDSLAWSLAERRAGRDQNDQDAAERWRAKLRQIVGVL